MRNAPQRPDGDQYRVLFEHSSDAHFIFDETGITDCNDATIRLLQAEDRKHVLALHPGVLSPEFQPDGRRSMEKAVEMVATAHAQGHHRFEWMHQKLNGDLLPVEVSANSVEIAGRPAMIVVWHDLTEIKRTESDLRSRSSELESANQILRSLNDRLKQSLQLAAQMQRALLPTVLPEVERVRFAWTFRPCDELAGDILNIYQLDAEHVGFYVLDVSGHGVSAALLSVTVSRLLSPHGPSSLLRMSANGRLAEPREVLESLNRQFSVERSDQFFTLFYGVLNLRTFELRYANAGHPGPIVVSNDGAIRTLQSPSFPLGVVDDAAYEDEMIQLRPGDRLWVYSDGLLEAMDDAGCQFGKERLDAELVTIHTASINEGVNQLLDTVENWAATTGPQDDISLIAVTITDR